MTTHLQIDHLRKSYGKALILADFSLKVEKGEFLSLLGPSGSGKTTVLRCIAGLELPDSDSGPIRLGEKTLSGPGVFIGPENRNFGMVFQNYAVWPHLNVFENVAFPLRIRARRHAPGGAGIQTRVAEVLEMVKLTGLEDRFSHQLSGGQQQRIALARALAMSPDLLLLDEPLSNLDALLREELGAEIRRLQRKFGLTTILVTHDRKEALSLSDRLVVLNRGGIEAEGTPEALYADPPSPFIAEFLSGAQVMEDLTRPAVKDRKRLFLPRRWKPVAEPGGDFSPFEIVSRIFLGSEYEYWAQAAKLSSPVRFFAAQRYEMGSKIHMEYSPDLK